MLAGRGWGKTKTGAEAIRDLVCGKTPHEPGRYRCVAIVAETSKDMRESVAPALLDCHPPEFRPTFSERNGFKWPNGAWAKVYNGTEPDQMRGPNLDLAWCDELAKWRYAQESWDMLQMCLRLGGHPRTIITTTPRPIPIIKDLVARNARSLRDGEPPDVVVTRGNTEDNRANLSPKFFSSVVSRYRGTRLGRQELNAEILDDVPGALWTRAGFDATREPRKPHELPDMQRIVVAIDPAAKESAATDDTSETGIIVAGLGVDGHAYVLDDLSCRLNPAGWASRAISAYDRYEADSLVVEINQGGAMVAQVIASVRDGLPIRQVRASKGKVTRAEPVAALYEQGRVSHVGAFPELEDQAVLFTPFGIQGDGAADRVDALVWALTDLFPSIISRIDANDWGETDFGVRGGGGWMR